MAKVLFSWIGHADLLAMAGHKPELMAKVAECIGKLTPAMGDGPLKVTCNNYSFDERYLIWNYKDKTLIEEYREYLGYKAIFITVNMRNPSDYSEIYKVISPILEQYYPNVKESEVFFLLSPGTPAMAAIWLLLGKTKYPAILLQAYKDKVEEAHIPFDLSLEVMPELIKKTGELLQGLPFKHPRDIPGFEEIVAESPLMKEVVARAYKAAMYDVSVLLTGESGTGKEMFATAIWKAGARRGKNFEAINCAALPANLLEAELFGYKKGAFTGAIQNKDGAFKRLDGGTLFLDEVGECTPELQAKLLRVLQPPVGASMTCREFYPIGADKPERSDVRIIAATNRDLRAMIGNDIFRSDLFFRLASITINLPTLQERREDILPIAKALLARTNAEISKNHPDFVSKKFSINTENFISSQKWSGNVRELLNAILQGIVMSDSDIINISDLGLKITEKNTLEVQITDIPPNFNINQWLDDAKRAYIHLAIEQSEGSITRAAKLLGISYQTLGNWQEKLRETKASV